MSQIAIPSTYPPMAKSIQTDYNEGWSQVRIITAIGAAPVDPLFTPPTNQCFQARCKTVLMRFFTDVTGAAPVIEIWSQSPPGGHLATDRTQLQQAAWSPYFVGTLTHSGFSHIGYNPITGAATAGTTWFAVSDFAAGTGHCSNLITDVPAIAAAAYEKRFAGDSFGETMWWPFATDISTATQIIVAMKQLE